MDVRLTEGLVLLRSYAADDVAPLYEAVRESIGEVGPWMAWCHAAYNLEDAEGWVASRQAAWNAKEEISLVIEDAESGQFLGGCGLNQLDLVNGRANLGYWVRTSATGRGVATTATRLLARYGLTQLELERIEIVAATGNLASCRVAEKVGAVREGIARRRFRVGDAQHDAVVYSLLRGEAP